MNAVEFSIGAIVGGVIWGLISYYLIRGFLNIEDRATDRRRHRARRRFRPVPKEED